MITKCQRTLVIDNDPVFLKLLTELLKQDGHQVTSTDRAFRCLDILAENSFDILFVDLIMPHMGGDDLCRAIRNLPNHQATFICIVSATAIELNIDYLSFGANACIAKGPFREMRHHIRDVIEEVRLQRFSPKINHIRGGEELYSRKITEELLQQHKHVQSILENMSQGVIEVTCNRIAYMNHSVAKMLNLSIHRTLGMEINQALPQPLQMAIGVDSASIQNKEKIPTKEVIMVNDRQLVIEELSLHDTVESRIIMLSDITENRKMEAVIEAANLTENLGYVFSGIRHEIGNPINSIKMALSVLQRNLKDYDKATVAEFLDRSLQEISRIEYLLKSLKNYSLFEKPVVQCIPLTDFLTDFIALIRSDFEQKKIKIRTIITSDNLMVWVDSRALHHVMLNIFTNAADALEQTASPEITISCIARGNMIEVKVDDNGKGISDNDYQHLFKPFFTSKTYGTGLGLVIVKKMLIAMQGTIQIESYKALGTTITITLPGNIDEQ